MKTLLLLLSTFLFVSCSNMTVGFEEDSPFYNGPMIDTRADAEANTEEKKIEKTQVVKETVEEETTFSYDRDEE